MRGKINRLIRKKGFGFINAENGEKVFFHHSELVGINFNTLKEGNKVDFNLEKGPRGFRAVKIRRCKGLRVTAIAKEKLKETIQKQSTDPLEIFRIIPSPSIQKQFELFLDYEIEGDRVVESKQGRKVLLIGSDISTMLEGMVLDYRESDQGAGFNISKFVSST